MYISKDPTNYLHSRVFRALEDHHLPRLPRRHRPISVRQVLDVLHGPVLLNYKGNLGL